MLQGYHLRHTRNTISSDMFSQKYSFHLNPNNTFRYQIEYSNAFYAFAVRKRWKNLVLYGNKYIDVYNNYTVL